jgi:aryl-alcohol dehydrogenase-like predicted oxidoreductase
MIFVCQHELHLIKQLGPDVFVIPGTRKEKYLLDNVESASLTLTTEEMAEIRRITESFSVSGDRYNPTMMAMVDKESSQ